MRKVIETLDRVLNKEHFYGKIMPKMCKKLVPDFLILVNNHMQEILLKIRTLEDYRKASQKLALFFLLSPVPFNGQSYQKQ